MRRNEPLTTSQTPILEQLHCEPAQGAQRDRRAQRDRSKYRDRCSQCQFGPRGHIDIAHPCKHYNEIEGVFASFEIRLKPPSRVLVGDVAGGWSAPEPQQPPTSLPSAESTHTRPVDLLIPASRAEIMRASTPMCTSFPSIVWKECKSARVVPATSRMRHRRSRAKAHQHLVNPHAIVQYMVQICVSRLRSDRSIGCSPLATTPCATSTSASSPSHLPLIATTRVSLACSLKNIL